MKPSNATRAPATASSFPSATSGPFPDAVVNLTGRDAVGNVGRPGLWWAALLGLCLMLVAPLWLVDVPPLLDYPNHLARLFVLASPDDPVFARFYEPHWGIIPNLALDLAVPPLLRAWPIHVVGRLVIGAILLLPVLGAVAWHRALTGRFSWWSLGVALFAWNAAMLRGFLNFVAAEGIALLLAAAWVAWRERRPRLAVFVAMAGAVALFFCHLIGLLFFALLIGAHEAAWFWTAWRRSGTPPHVRLYVLFGRLAPLALVFAAPVVLYAMSDLGHLGGSAEFRTVLGKARTAVTPVVNYVWPLDLATAALCVVTGTVCLVRRWCVVPLQAALALGGLTALFLVSPHAFKGTFDLDTRFILMAAAIAPAALVPIAVPYRAVRLIGIGFLLLFGVRMGALMTTWDAWRGEVSGFRAVIASVHPGDVVMTVRLPRGPDSSVWDLSPHPRRLSDGTVTDAHLPALLLIEHRAWWPFLFDNPSQQPLVGRERFQRLAERIDSLPDPLVLLAGDTPERRLITHVLILGLGEADAEGLEAVARNAMATLFRVPPLVFPSPASATAPSGPPPAR